MRSVTTSTRPVGQCGHMYRMNCFYRQAGSVVCVCVCLCVCVCVGPCGHMYRTNCFYRQTGSVVSVYVCLCLCVGQCGHTYRMNCFYQWDRILNAAYCYRCVAWPVLLCVCVWTVSTDEAVSQAGRRHFGKLAAFLPNDAIRYTLSASVFENNRRILRFFLKILHYACITLPYLIV